MNRPIRKSGNPSRTSSNPERVSKATRDVLELVRDLEGKLSEDTHTHLKASALGLMFALAELTGQPSPYERINK